MHAKTYFKDIMKSRIDLDSWKRKEHFEHFSKTALPYYQVAADVDVSGLLRYCRSNGISFYLSLIYEVMKAVNSIENFRYRIIDGEVWLYDRVHPSFCHLPEGEDLFKVTTCRSEDELNTFIDRAGSLMSAQKSFIGGDELDSNSLIYISCLPWIETTVISNEHSSNPDDSIPMINWGRYRTEGDRTVLNITVDVNHRLIDGYHIGLFFRRLGENVSKYQNA